jgi:hypothetical protein
MGWRLVADAVVLVHLAFVVFVVAGGLLALRWRRVALVHLPVVVYGVLIELIGFTCPLTPLEKWFRGRAGSEAYDGGFVEQYVVPVLYPGELTPTVEVALAASLVVSSAAVYGVVWQRARCSPGALHRASAQVSQDVASMPSTEARNAPSSATLSNPSARAVLPSPRRGVSKPDEWAPNSAPSTTARCDVTVPQQF